MSSIPEEQMQAAEKEWLDGWKQGPQRLRWNKIPLQVGDAAPEFELANSHGEQLRISTSWQDRPALILFWLHYGCGCGIDRAAMLSREWDSYQAAGANVLIIGQGEPERAAAYARKYELPDLPILCDPDFIAYEEYGLVEGKPSQILFDASDEFLDRDLETGLNLVEEGKSWGDRWSTMVGCSPENSLSTSKALSDSRIATTIAKISPTFECCSRQFAKPESRALRGVRLMDPLLQSVPSGRASNRQLLNRPHVAENMRVVNWATQ